MIYVSSSCVRNEYIWESVEQLALAGFKNIELSGGTKRSGKIIEKLLGIQEKYSLNYRCHNYFPPPNDDFVMNLASKSEEIFNKSVNIISEALDFSLLFGATKYGFHAGFLTDITAQEIGKRVTKRPLNDKRETLTRFTKRVKEIMDSDQGVDLYIENNVVSKNNFKIFQNKNPFLLTGYYDFIDLKENLDFNLLLDVAHLYVSANTLGKNFQSEFSSLINESNYIHVSDNDGFADENKKLQIGSDIYIALSSACLKNKTFTLEINEDLSGLSETYQIMDDLITQ